MAKVFYVFQCCCLCACWCTCVFLSVVDARARVLYRARVVAADTSQRQTLNDLAGCRTNDAKNRPRRKASRTDALRPQAYQTVFFLTLPYAYTMTYFQRLFMDGMDGGGGVIYFKY